ncbi:MAG: alpha/beta hydrolase-fold protein [Bacteroidota bacterium]
MLQNKDNPSNLHQASKQSVVIEMTTLEQDDRPVYICGNFNNWQVDDPAYQLKKIDKGQYRLELQTDTSYPIEYQYIRGGWSNAELTVDGKRPANRMLSQYRPVVKDYVPLWLKNGKVYQEQYLPKIQIIEADFDIPSQIKTRRISALLPHDYDETQRAYPVLYLQDGQNLFDDYAPFGNWAVDKKLAMLTERGMGNVIVIAIDHAAEQRIAEFTPSHETKLGVGNGKQYLQFLAKTLKPYVDQHFRTLPDREHTGIGGSSMGGLISIYAGIIHPEIYGKLMIFSPSLWVAPNIHFHAIQFKASYDTRIYLYGGGREGANMIPNIRRFKKALYQRGADETKYSFQLSIDPEGQHNEARWGTEFPHAIAWLYFKA